MVVCEVAFHELYSVESALGIHSSVEGVIYVCLQEKDSPFPPYDLILLSKPDGQWHN